MFVCAGFALIPLFAHSAPMAEGVSQNAVVVPLPDARILVPEIHPHSDPFARALPAGRERKVARVSPTPKKSDVRVVAIVMGHVPHALLTIEGGTTQIVGLGDAIEGTRVVSIAADMVVLSDGRRLQFSENKS